MVRDLGTFQRNLLFPFTVYKSALCR